MHCRIRPVAGASLSLQGTVSAACTARSEERKCVARLHMGPRPSPGRAGGAEGKGRVTWGAGGRMGKLLCASGMCGVLAGLFYVSRPAALRS